MTVGIVGLGLIGGSMAKAYKKAAHTVYGYDKNESVNEFAILSKVLDKKLTLDNVCECDIVIIALYPKDAINYLKTVSGKINRRALVIDCCGTKREICPVGFDEADRHGFTFVGGHPMAGTHNSGFKYSDENLFCGAPMVIVPPIYDDIELLDRVKNLLSPAGFGFISVTTAKKHDEMIAFTSQMAHIISSAYIKSPTASLHKGFSAGSYRDMTRVAWLNPAMWTELFLCNRDNLVKELDSFIEEIYKYRKAIADSDMSALATLLDEGKKRKEELDGV